MPKNFPCCCIALLEEWAEERAGVTGAALGCALRSNALCPAAAAAAAACRPAGRAHAQYDTLARFILSQGSACCLPRLGSTHFGLCRHPGDTSDPHQSAKALNVLTPPHFTRATCTQMLQALASCCFPAPENPAAVAPSPHSAAEPAPPLKVSSQKSNLRMSAAARSKE